MSLISLIPKLVEKTQQGKITWTKSSHSEFNYISNALDSSVISIEQILLVGENVFEAVYYIKLFDVKNDTTTLEFMEKVEIAKISGLLKEVRNQVNQKKHSEKIDGLKNYLETL